MVRHQWLSALAAAAAAASSACGSRQETMPPHHLSASEHHQEAQRHDRAASERELDASVVRGEGAGAGAQVGCFDQPIPDPELGGERVPVLRPCWSSEIRPTSDSERDAARHRRQAASHRSTAAEMWRAEREACAGLGEDEISHSPFFHRDDIARVEPMRDGHRLVGARVLFRRVRGLDEGWMRRSITCHQARAAALGYPLRVMSYCPLMVGPTRTAVETRADGLVVTITATRDEDAAAVLGRARALIER